MRTNIDIDEALMAQTLKLSGAKTKRDAVHEAMREYVRFRRQRDIKKLFGKIEWIGDLDEMRRNA